MLFPRVTRRILCVVVCLLSVNGCDRGQPATAGPSIPADVLRELDAMRDIARATHDEYERLYTSVVFATDEKKESAATWYRNKQRDWETLQFMDLRTRRLGLPESPLDMLMLINWSDSFIESKPTVFVETTYYPRVVEKELLSVAKLRSLRQDYDAAQLRLVKALLASERSASEAPLRK